MKTKSTILAIAASCCISLLNAGDFDTNKFTAMQKFYYELGAKQSAKTNYENGYNRALQDFSKMLKKYEDKIRAIEAGKYLIESSKITYPEVYKTRTSDGGYQIHIETPTVEKEFSANDLFIVPLLDGTKQVGSKPKNVQYPSTLSSITDGFSIPSMSGKISNTPVKPRNVTNKVFLDIRYKSSKIKEFLDTYGASYATSDAGYKVEFSNEMEKRKFCQDLTGEPNCYGLN